MNVRKMNRLFVVAITLLALVLPASLEKPQSIVADGSGPIPPLPPQPPQSIVADGSGPIPPLPPQPPQSIIPYAA